MVNITNLYNKAVQAIEKRNFDYAIEMLLQCISLDPDNLEVRKKLRSTARHRIEERGSRSLGKLKSGFGIIKGIFDTKVKKDTEKAILDYEKSLTSNPNNITLLRNLGTACLNGGHIKSAIWVFEDAHELDPENIKVLENMVQVYEKAGKIIPAQEACQKILDLDQTNRDALKKAKDLAAKETIDRGKYAKARSYRDSVKSEQMQDDLEVKERILRTDAEVEKAISMTKRQIKEDPESTRLFMKLGDLFKRLRKWDEARAAYNKAFELDQADFTIQHKQGQLELDKLKIEVDKAKEIYRKNKSDAKAKQEYTQRLKQFNKRTLEEYTKRVKAQPTNGTYHFQLGEHLFRLKKYRDAIAEFQKVEHDPEVRLPSLNYLGQSFTALENYDLAEKKYLEGLEKTQIITDRIKPIIYNLGKLYVQTGEIQKAIEQFNKIYEVDINFRDVADVLDSLKSKL